MKRFAKWAGIGLSATIVPVVGVALAGPALVQADRAASSAERSGIAEAAAVRPRLKVCDSDTTDGDDMRARNIRCSTARRVYSRSLRVALRDPDAEVTRFRLYGLRWTCRARNTDIYEWRCRASGRRLMWYRWLGGE